MTTLKEMFPSDYFKAEDLKGKDVALTISRVAHEELYIPGSGKEWAYVVYFKEAEAAHEKDSSKPNKRLFCNKTNATTIFQVTGTEHFEDWPGHKVVLYPTTTQRGRETVPCIRVRGK